MICLAIIMKIVWMHNTFGEKLNELLDRQPVVWLRHVSNVLWMLQMLKHISYMWWNSIAYGINGALKLDFAALAIECSLLLVLFRGRFRRDILTFWNWTTTRHATAIFLKPIMRQSSLNSTHNFKGTRVLQWRMQVKDWKCRQIFRVNCKFSNDRPAGQLKRRQRKPYWYCCSSSSMTSLGICNTKWTAAKYWGLARSFDIYPEDFDESTAGLG